MAKITIGSLGSGTPPPLDGNEVIAIVRAGSTKNAKLYELPVSTPTDTAINNAVSPLNDFRVWSASRTYLSDTPVFYLGEPYKPNALDMPIAGESPATHPAKWTKTGGGGSVIGNISPDPDGSKGAVNWTGTVATIANGLTGFATELSITADSVWTIPVPTQLRGEALELRFEAFVNSGTGITVKMYSDSGATVEIPMTSTGLNATGKTAFVGKFWSVGANVYLKVAGTAFDLRMTNIYVGRPESVQGAVVSDWIPYPAGTYSVAGVANPVTIATPGRIPAMQVSSNPTKSTVFTTDLAEYKRDSGDILLHFLFDGTSGGTDGSGVAVLPMPLGFTTTHPLGTSTFQNQLVGYGSHHHPSVIQAIMRPWVFRDNAIKIGYLNDTASGELSFLATGDKKFELFVRLPCAQFTSSMTIVGMNEPFFLSNSESVVNTNGVAGKTQVGTWAPILANTAATYYDLTLPRPLMLGEKPKIILRSKVDGSCVPAELVGVPSLFCKISHSYHDATNGEDNGFWIERVAANQLRLRQSARCIGFTSYATNAPPVGRTWAQIIAAADGYDAWMVEISRGGEAWAVPPVVKVTARKTANQAVTADVTNINFESEITDTNSCWDGTTFTCPANGWYRFELNGFSSAGGGGVFFLYVAGVKQSDLGFAYISTVTYTSGSVEKYIALGQTVTIRFQQTQTVVPLSTHGGRLDITRIGS